MFNAIKQGMDTAAIEEAWINETLKADSTIIKLNATHSVLSLKLQEIRYDRRHTVKHVKQDLEYRFGSPEANQVLSLKDEQGNEVAKMSEDHLSLEDYGAKTGFCIHVVDTNPSEMISNLDDLTQVEKYEMPDDEYDKRDNTFRQFKKKMMAQNPNFMNAHAI